MTKKLIATTLALAAVTLLFAAPAFAQTGTPKPAPKPAMTPPPAPAPNYIIGPDDVLSIAVWKQDEASGDVIVRPDGKITLRLGSDIVASGLTVDELKDKVTVELKKFY